MPTIREILHSEEKNVPRFEIEILLAHALKKTRVFVLAHPDFHVAQKIKERFDRFLERRKNHEPIALIMRSKEFYGREFLVNQYTLVPRPETELLIEKTLEHLASPTVFPKEKILSPKNSEKKFWTLLIDIGTGSGNIMTTLVKEIEAKNISRENFFYIATDISKEALLVAKKNAQKYNAEENIRFIQSDILENIPKKLFRSAHEIVITANLPYLSKKEYAAAPPDVRSYEPQSALESGKDGLDHYRKLLQEISCLFIEERQSVAPITLFFEISPPQKSSLQRLVSGIFPKASITFFQDLAKKFRMARIHITPNYTEVFHHARRDFKKKLFEH